MSESCRSRPRSPVGELPCRSSPRFPPDRTTFSCRHFPEGAFCALYSTTQQLDELIASSLQISSVSFPAPRASGKRGRDFGQGLHADPAPEEAAWLEALRRVTPIRRFVRPMAVGFEEAVEILGLLSPARAAVPAAVLADASTILLWRMETTQVFNW